MSRDRMKRADDRTDEGYMSCSRDARLLYSEMAHDCDDGGVMPASLIKLKALAFPGDSDLNAESMRRLMDELIQNRLVIEFEAEGRKFWHYLNWSEKQKVQRPTFRYPQPTPEQIRDAMREIAPGEFHEDSRRIPGGLTEDSPTPPPELKRIEEKGIEENTPLPPTGGDGPVVQTIVESWNAIPDVPKVSKLTDKRLRALKARLKDSGFRENWQAGLQAISRSDFCRGLKPGASWRADFDWFLKPDTLVVLLEGKYENPSGQPGTRPAAKPETTDTAAGPLLRITTEEAADAEKFNGWIDRQQSFELNDGTRRYLHAVRCTTARLFRKPEVARDQLYARLHDRARGVEIESPSYDDWEQAKADLETILQPAGGAE